MRSTRAFRPAFVAAVPDGWLAVDEIQPVAVAVGPAGNVLDIVCWNDLPVPTLAWPRRRVVADGRGVWVHDRPDGPTVRIDAAGGLTAVPAALPADTRSLSTAYSNFRRTRRSGSVGGEQWWFRSELIDDCRWTAHAHRLSEPRGSWALGDGAVCDSAVGPTGAAVCVRRGTKRPWVFRPAHDLLLLDGPEPIAVFPGGLDVAARCWPEPTLEQITDLLVDYLPYSARVCRTAIAEGAAEARFTVAGMDGLPTVELSFRWGPNGTRFVRVDEPVDELGRSAGFAWLNISLDEDMTASPLFVRNFDRETAVL